MYNKIDEKYINNAIKELTDQLGVRGSIPKATVRNLLSVGRVKESIEIIANYLGLPITVNLSYVEANYNRSNAGNRFDSSALAETGDTGQGIGGIVAQVIIPSYLPLFGTPGMQGLPISVKVSSNCQEHPQAFLTIMAHELSHIVLHSVLHTKKDNEFYTDLTAMILGFSDVMRNGRKVVKTSQNSMLAGTTIVTNTTTYGYLSDELFDFAYQQIKDILKGNIGLYEKIRKEALQRRTIYRKQFTSYKQQIYKFKKFIEYVDRHPNKRYREEDIPKIIQFHQTDYTNKFEAILKSNMGKLQEVNDLSAKLIKHSRYYNSSRLDSARKLLRQLNDISSHLGKESELLASDISVLDKYVGFLGRFQISRQVHSLLKN